MTAIVKGVGTPFDNMWRHVVAQEKQGASRWLRHWGSILDVFDETNQLLAPEVKKESDPEDPDAIPLTEQYKELQGDVLPPVLKMGRAVPSRPIVPQTTTGMIGWKSTDPDWQLEIYGKYSPLQRNRNDTYKTLGMPHGAL